ncbi:uncharacterized protein LOC121250157 isoform X2 [Juglans microcarpa x Juglans regia]|uniref:uncharacterized protein LOC121250157 isoform X2 n=1 Tax=Juglans microcarpa x Juglans regia TaxID=2249226 RepID=UPI001B7D96D4|nr:uncharacterized protein LOC121250157 isoform X2 [Juglans microcarpa x Juglans regia]
MKLKAEELRFPFLFPYNNFYFLCAGSSHYQNLHSLLTNSGWFLSMTTDLVEFHGSSMQEEGRRRKEIRKDGGRGYNAIIFIERIRASKDLTETKQLAEENERKRYLALRKAEKEEEKRARDKVLRKLEQDKVRRYHLGLPPERPAALKPSTPLFQEKRLQTLLPVKSVTKAEHMKECLRTIKHNHQDDGARVRRAFQTLLIYIRNVAKNPDEEKFRKIRLSNLLFQDRVGNLRGGVEFLELCGFERTGGEEYLYLPRDEAVLNTVGFELKSAMTNPFFGVLSGQEVIAV